MTGSVTCQGCGHRLRAKPEWAGRRGRCPQCGRAIHIPAAADSPTTLPPVIEKSPPVASAQATQSAGSSSDPRIEKYTARRRGIRLPVWSWFAASGVVLAALLAGAWLNHRGEMARRESTRIAIAEQRDDDATDRSGQSSFAHEPAQPPDVAKPAAGGSWQEIYPYVEHGIVKIETYDRDNNRTGLGSGFIVEAGGLVATSYHVAAAAYDKADVLFNDGTRFGVEGYAAVLPTRDLAILKLNGVPPNVRSLDLALLDAPAEAASVYAIGHPLNHNFVPTAGNISRLVGTPDLPAESRQFLDALLGDAPDNRWIEHDAAISPGNSGGPLLNSAGEVIGVNTWVNRQTRLGYALHVSHLAELLEAPLAAVVRLSDHYQEPHERLARIHMQPYVVTAARIEELRQACQVLDWQVHAPDDYQTFKELAVVLTYARRTEERILENPATRDADAEQVVRQARASLAELERVSWDLARVDAINRRAVAELAEPLAGVFVLARVERLWEGGDGRRGLVLSVVNAEQTLFVPLIDAVAAPEIGAARLVLGLSYPARLPHGENPLQPDQSQVVLSKLILPVLIDADEG